jgi:O-antigen/teichoic acid export membrane protein
MPDPEHSIARQFLAGSLWAFSGKVVALLAALTVNALLARLLDPESFGIYFLASSIIAVAGILASLGLNNAVVRLLGELRIVEQGRRARNIIVQCLLIGLCGAVAAGLLIAGPAGTWLAQRVFKSELLTLCLGWMAVWLMAVTVQILVAECHRGIKKIHLASLLGGPLAAVGLSLLLIAAYLLDVQLTVRGAIALSAVTTLVVIPIGITLLWRHVGPSASTEYVRIKHLFSLALPMLVTNLSLIVLNQADIWIVGIFLEKHQIALYGVTLQIASLIGFPLVVVNSVIPPHVADARRLDRRAELEGAIRRATGFAAYASIAGFSFCVLLAPWVLEVIYGGYYQQASGIFIVIAIGRLANVLAGPCGLVLMMTGFHRIMMWVAILSSLVTVTAMSLIVDDYGLLGVATIAALMMIAQNAAMLWLARAKSGIWTHAQLDPKVLFAA